MQKKILWIAIALYVLVMTGASFWKYEQMRYNAIDLAYYNHVFWKTIGGDLFGLTIHPHISLGDHVEPIILVLAPFYALFPDARMLLLLQTLALALTALPIYSLASLLIKRGNTLRDSMGGGTEIATERPMKPPRAWRPDPIGTSGWLNKNEQAAGAQRVFARGDSVTGPQKNRTGFLPLLLSLLWLLNPLVQNINLFEFHILPFALLPLFYALLAYEEKRIGKFVLWSLLALAVREDVALVVAAFALVALADRAKKQWVLVPLLLGSVWFVATQKIAAYFAVGGAYKFLYYYAWLGNSFPEILVNLFRNPLAVLAHITTENTVLLFLALGMPFLFLFLARPRALLLTILVLLQNLLARYGGTPLIAETHYVTLFLPGLVLATIMALIHPPRFLAALPLRSLLVIATIYSMAMLGPLPGIAMERTSPQELQSRAFFIGKIPVEARVATTESFLTPLSRRNALYLLRYATAGKTQFNKAPYALPPDVAYILIDTNDLVAYPQKDAARLRDLLAPFGVITAQEQFFLLQREEGVPLFDEEKQKAPEARITNEYPCSVLPLARCARLTLTVSNDANVFLLNANTAQLFPLSINTYWFRETTPIASIETGKATSTTALARDRSTVYQRDVTDRRNLQISRQ